VSLNLHWVECDPDNRAQAFCNFTVMENRKLIVKSGNGAELADFDAATAAYQARFRFLDRKGKQQVCSDFAAKNVADRAIELGEPWKREYELIYHLTSMHTHGAPGAILHSFFLPHYSFPEIRERNSVALIAIVAIRVMVRLVQLLIRLGLLQAETTAQVEKCYTAFEETMKAVKSQGK
jgi:hypothetical protein